MDGVRAMTESVKAKVLVIGLALCGLIFADRVHAECAAVQPDLLIKEAAVVALGQVERVRRLSRTDRNGRVETVYVSNVRGVRVLEGGVAPQRFGYSYSEFENANSASNNCPEPSFPVVQGEEAIFFFRAGEAEPFMALPPEAYASIVPPRDSQRDEVAQ